MMDRPIPFWTFGAVLQVYKDSGCEDSAPFPVDEHMFFQLQLVRVDDVTANMRVAHLKPAGVGAKRGGWV